MTELSAPAIDDRELPFPVSEFDHRVAGVRSALVAAGLAGGVYFAPEDIYYLSGYNTPGNYYGFQALVVPVDSEPFFVCRLVEESNVVGRSVVERRHVFTDTDNPADVLVAALRAEGLAESRLEVDSHSVALSPAHYLRVQAGIGEEWIDSKSRCLAGQRRVKSDAEVAFIREAARVMRAGLDAAVTAVADGSTEDDVAAACYSALILAGGEYPGMPPMIASGPRAGLGHATWEGHRRMREGDVVLLEIPGCVKRYHACQARSVSIGPPSATYQERMDVLLEARASAVATIRPGATSSEVDAALRRPLIASGLADHHLHRAGYGLGIAYPPHWDEGGIVSLKAGDDTVLSENMVFHLLPALYYFNETLLACTETVLVTTDGCEVLTPNVNGFIVK